MVIVYTKPSCIQCDMTKRMLDKIGVDYTTVDIMQDSDALDMILGMGFQSAPVIITESDSWSGFNPDKINSLAA
jgi:glutaredoxin-like protein NrdH